ncbi:hypothetical protein CSB09_03615 [Candidatus Gracilibacteria bacterium]|nr:MAG: hypothetical protein CSB09_03615 [Candidatus Gracilibacteria bacterium]
MNLKILLKVIKAYIEYLGKFKFITFVLFGVFVAGLSSLEPLFFAKVISYIENFYETGNFETHNFIRFLGFWAIFILFNVTFVYIYRYFINDKPPLSFLNYVAKKYAGSAYKMTMGTYLGKKQGSIYKNFDRGIEVHFRSMFWLFNQFIPTVSSLIIILVIMLWTSPIMTAASLAMLPFMAIAGYITMKKTRGPQKKVNKIWIDAFGVIGDFLGNMSLGKILSLESNFIKKFHIKIQEGLSNQLLVSRWWSANDVITRIFVMISRFIVLGLGVYLISTGEISLATLILMVGYLGFVYFPLTFLFNSLGQMQEWEVQIKKFYDEFETVDTEHLDNGNDIENTQGNIEFRNVHFSYDTKRKILKNLSFAVKKGQKVALVGSTGAGKSTITNLLFRFWDIKKGEILLDGQNIAKISKKSLRKHIGIVSQDNSLFNMSVKENLLLAKPDASEKELKNALTKASADFVFELEDGIDTLIGERGLKLSGGEKQRISIARLFLKNPEVLILDEATSALDTATEQKITAALDTLMKGRTSIIIAHRLSTIQNADTIFMLENGEIVESGTYDELIAKNGKFAQMANPEHLVIR